MGLGGPGFQWLVRGRGEGKWSPSQGNSSHALCNGELTAAPARNDGRRAGGGLQGSSRGAARVQGVARPPLSSPRPTASQMLAGPRCQNHGPAKPPRTLWGAARSLGGESAALCSAAPASGGRGAALLLWGASPFSPPARCPPPNASLLPLGCGVPRLPCDRPRPRGQPSRPVSGGEGAAGRMQWGCRQLLGLRVRKQCPRPHWRPLPKPRSTEYLPPVGGWAGAPASSPQTLVRGGPHSLRAPGREGQ